MDFPNVPQSFLIAKTAEPLAVRQWVLQTEKTRRHELCLHILRVLYQTPKTTNTLACVKSMVEHPLIKFRPTYEELKDLSRLAISQQDVTVYLIESPHLDCHMPIQGKDGVLKQAILSDADQVVDVIMNAKCPPTYDTLLSGLGHVFQSWSHFSNQKDKRKVYPVLIKAMKAHKGKDLAKDVVEWACKKPSHKGMERVMDTFGWDTVLRLVLQSQEKGSSLALSSFEELANKGKLPVDDIANIVGEEEAWVEKAKPHAQQMHAKALHVLLKRVSNEGQLSPKKKM